MANNKHNNWKDYILSPKSRIVRPIQFAIAPADFDGSQDVKFDWSDYTEESGITLKVGESLLLDFGKKVTGHVLINSSERNEFGLKIRSGPTLKLVKFDADLSYNSEVSWWRDPQFRAFRYLLITGAKEEEIHFGIELEFTGYPGEYKGWFHCSDELLNRIWYAGAYTIQLCTQPHEESGSYNEMLPRKFGDFPKNWRSPYGRYVIWDGPRRDREVWIGDMWPECLALLYSFHAPEVMKSSLMAVAVNQFDDGMIPGSGISNQQFAEYSCWWMALLDRFYFLTGDEEFIHDLAPYIRRHMNWLVGTIDENGGYLHVDQGRTWAWTLMRQGVVTGSQCVAFAALQGGARMLELIGDTSEAASSRELAANLKNLIQTKLWDDEEGALRDSKEPPDGIPRYSCDSNSLGALFGVLDEDKAKRALAFLKKNLWTKYGTRTIFPPEPDGEKNWAHNHNIWPFVVGLELEARFETADFENALELARTCWGTMIANDAEAFWEIIDSETGEFLTRRRIVEGDPNWDSWDSYSHGWSAGITYMFQAFLLGVRPLEPGFRRFQVTPHLAGLDFISGAVPTPHGQIRVKLKANELEVTVPEGTEAVVAIGTSDSKVLQPGHHKLTV